jgi:transposase
LTSTRKPLSAIQIKTIAGWRDRAESATLVTCRREAIRLAKRIGVLNDDLATNRADLTTLVSKDTPQLLEAPGVGAVVAASVLIAWSHPGRVRSDAALASLAGTCPIPASSGNTVRHRLNRGGDRRLNQALTTVTIVRMRIDPATRAYVTRRRAEGLSTKEIMRCLKRYITRQMFRTLTAAHTPATT